MEPTTETANPPQTPANPPQTVTPPGQRSVPITQKDLRWKKLSSSNPRLRVILAVSVLALLVAAFFLWRYFGSYESTDDAQIDGHLNPISSRVPGYVQKLLVSDNQYVQAGTPLVQIDAKDYQVALDRARADYGDAVATAESAGVNVPITSVSSSSQESAAQADVENARAGIAWAQQQLDAAKAQLEQAEANNTRAQNDLGRYQQLVDKQEISQQQYDQALAAAKASTATVAAARAAVAAGQQTVVQYQSKLAQSQANLRAASTAPQQVSVVRSRAASALAIAQRRKAEVEQAELNLGYTTIVAPVTGIVSNRTVEVGQNVQAGQELLKLIPLDDIWVTANFKETQLKQMRAGQVSSIAVDANGKTYKGHIDSLAGASGALFSLLPPENATGNYVKVVQRLPIKIVFEPGETKEHVLRPGMSVIAKVSIR